MVRLLASNSTCRASPDDLGDRPVMGKHDIGHAHEIFVEQCSQYIRFQRLHQCGEARGLGERRYDARRCPLIDRVGVAGKPLRKVRREIARQRRIGSFGLGLARRASRRNSIWRNLLRSSSLNREINRLGHEIERARFIAVRIFAMSP